MAKIDFSDVRRQLDYSEGIEAATTPDRVELISGIEFSVTVLPTATRWLVAGYTVQVSRGSANRRSKGRKAAGYYRDNAAPSPMKSYLEGERDARRRYRASKVQIRIRFSITPRVIL